MFHSIYTAIIIYTASNCPFLILVPLSATWAWQNIEAEVGFNGPQGTKK